MRSEDVQSVVEVLNACQAHSRGDEALWRWKHADRPGFDPGDVFVACSGEKVVGCFHWAILPVEIEEGLVLPMSFDGDFAVLPGYRGRGVPLRAYLGGEPQLAARGAVLRGGFTSPDLNEKFYRPLFGYEFASGVTCQYRKYLGPGPLAPRVAALGERLLALPAVRGVLARPLLVELAIEGFPVCHLELAATGFRLAPGPMPEARLHARVPYLLLTLCAGGMRPGAGTLFRALLACRLRPGELVREAPRLWALAWAAVRR